MGVSVLLFRASNSSSMCCLSYRGVTCLCTCVYFFFFFGGKKGLQIHGIAVFSLYNADFFNSLFFAGGGVTGQGDILVTLVFNSVRCLLLTDSV